MNPKYLYYAIIVLFFNFTIYFWLDNRFEDAVISGILMVAMLQWANIMEKVR
jgi:hypothetical protein